MEETIQVEIERGTEVKSSVFSMKRYKKKVE